MLGFISTEITMFCKGRANGRRYRQGRELADKAARRSIRHQDIVPESAGSAPHLSGARGVGPFEPYEELTDSNDQI